MSVNSSSTFRDKFYCITIFFFTSYESTGYISTQQGIRNEIGIMRGSGGVATSGLGCLGVEPPVLGDFYNFCNKNDVFSDMFVLKFELQTIF